MARLNFKDCGGRRRASLLSRGGDVLHHIGELLADQCLGLWSVGRGARGLLATPAVSVEGCDGLPEWGAGLNCCDTLQCVLHGGSLTIVSAELWWAGLYRVVSFMEFSHKPTPLMGCTHRRGLMLCFDAASNLVLEFESAKREKKSIQIFCY